MNVGHPRSPYHHVRLITSTGSGEADNEWNQVHEVERPTSPTARPSFAPRTSSWVGGRISLHLNLDGFSSRNFIEHLHDSCSVSLLIYFTQPWLIFQQSALNSRIGRTENLLFLERFRYILVASQLLNRQPNHTSYERRNHPNLSEDATRFSLDEIQPSSLYGVIATGVASFAFAWSLNWVRELRKASVSPWKLMIVILVVFLGITAFYRYFRRQRLHNLRGRAVEVAASYVNASRSFDAVASATVALIQEVELVARGYRLSFPLPPITRIDDNSQTRRCARLRKTIATSVESLTTPYYQAYQTLKEHANDIEIEKYYDIYEISQSDLHDVEKSAPTSDLDPGMADTLKAIKSRLLRLHLARKMFLCSLLALDAHGGHCDFKIWPVATEYMRRFGCVTARCASELEQSLGGEHAFPVPATPKTTSSPAQERLRAQMRKIGSLSSGIRSLQAKMQLLREESENALNDSEEITDLGSNLLEQYDSVGEDLKILMQEWEEGRTALAVNIDKNEHRLSMSPRNSLVPISPTLSLGGLTAVSGSPREALKVIDGNSMHSRSRSNTDISNSSNEVFEAIAAPRQKSALTRDERIIKMKEDRVRREVAMEKAQASTHMLKELETVIKLRPRGRTTGRETLV